MQPVDVHKLADEARFNGFHAPVSFVAGLGIGGVLEPLLQSMPSLLKRQRIDEFKAIASRIGARDKCRHRGRRARNPLQMTSCTMLRRG